MCCFAQLTGRSEIFLHLCQLQGQKNKAKFSPIFCASSSLFPPPCRPCAATPAARSGWRAPPLRVPFLGLCVKTLAPPYGDFRKMPQVFEGGIFLSFKERRGEKDGEGKTQPI